MTTARRSLCAPLLVTLALAAGCNKGEQPKTVSLGQPGAAAAGGAGGQLPPGHPGIAPENPIPAAAKVYLDSGNVAYRAKQYDVAQRYYEKAATLAPDHGAPWFGLYMIGGVTHNKKLEDSALAEVKRRVPQDAAAPMPSPMPSPTDTALRNPHAALRKS